MGEFGKWNIFLSNDKILNLISDQTLAALLRLGAGMIDLRVPETRLPPLNDSQRNAVHAALGRTFSIIQGPPGKSHGRFISVTLQLSGVVDVVQWIRSQTNLGGPWF